MSEHITIGMDLGDRHHIIVVFDNNGNEMAIKRITNTKLALVAFVMAVPYQAQLARIAHIDNQAQLLKLTADPRRMRTGFYRHGCTFCSLRSIFLNI